MSAINNIKRSVALKTRFADASALTSSAISYNQGDLLYLDTSAHLIKKQSAEGDAATFLGVALETVSSGILKRPFSTDVDSSQAAGAVPGPGFGVNVRLQLKNGDSLNPGDLVYSDPSTGPQNVQASGTKAIGIYQGAAVTAGASTFVEVLLGARYPGDSLTF